MGVSDHQILEVMKNYKGVTWTVLIVALIIGIISLGNVLGQGLLEQQPGYYTQNPDGTYTTSGGVVVSEIPPGGVASTSYQGNFTRTLFNPKILSFALLGLIATFTVYFMTKTYT